MTSKERFLKYVSFHTASDENSETSPSTMRQFDLAKVLKADVVVWATPISYYEMSGQMKTLLDRMNPLYAADYRFRRVYMLSTATEDEATTPEKAVNGLQGWVDCFEKAELIDSLFCGGISDPGEAKTKEAELEEAYQFGRSIL